MSSAWPLPEDLPEQLAGRGWRILERAPGYPECARSIVRTVRAGGRRLNASVRCAAGSHPRHPVPRGFWKMEIWSENQPPYSARTSLSHVFLRKRSRDPLALAADADQELERLEAALRLGWKP